MNTPFPPCCEGEKRKARDSNVDFSITWGNVILFPTTQKRTPSLCCWLPLFFRAYVIAGSKRCSMCQRRRCQPGWHFRVFRGPVAAAAEIFYKQENHSTNIFSRHGSNVHHRAAAAAGQRALFISWRGGIKKEEGGKIKHLKRPRRK